MQGEKVNDLIKNKKLSLETFIKMKNKYSCLEFLIGKEDFNKIRNA